MSYAMMARKRESAPAAKAKAPSKAVSSGLRIGEPNDAFEREADRVTNEVMAGGRPRRDWSLSRMSVDAPLQRKCSCGGSGGSSGECEECKKKKEEQTLQRKAAGPAETNVAPPIVHEVLNSPGRPLDRASREFFEPRFGFDFGSVRVHTGSRAAESAKTVRARAYTVGQNLVFANSQYSPHSTEGRKLLSHELAHIVQQSGGNLAVVRTKENGVTKLTPAQQSVQRQCSPAPCPPAPVPIGSYPPTPQQAEVCLQEQYAGTHPNSKPGISLGFNRGWIALTGASLPERQALTCLKGGTTAKSGVNFTARHGMYAAQPDIWDFANRTMYEITTASQAGFKSGDTGKLAAQIKLANDITGVPECGGLMFSPGGWVPSPSPCCLLPSGLYISTVNVGGVLVYTPLKDMTKELTLAALLALLATLAKKGGGAAGGELAGAAAKGAGKAAPVYAIASLVATAVLLASGKAEAKPGPGSEEPIIQLFQALAQKGTPVPPEIQQLIQDDPELKAKVNKALEKGGDPTAAQKELNDKILKIIADNPDQFSKDDLEKIVTMTAVAGKALPQGDTTVASVRKLLDQKGGAGGSGAGSGAGKENVWERAKHPDAAVGQGTPDQTPQQQPAPEQKDKSEAPGKGTAPSGAPPKPSPWDKAKYPALSDDSIGKITAAKGPVKSLWDVLTTGSGEGSKVTDAITNQFFQIVPPDLTAEQAANLIQRLAPAGQVSAEEVLASIKAGIEQLQKKQKEQEAAAAESAVVSIEPSKAAKKDTQPDSDLINKLADLAKKGDFGGISPGEVRLVWGKEDAGSINATLKAVSPKRVNGAGRVRGQILHREGSKLTIRIVAATPIVAPDGAILRDAGGVVGNTQVYTLVGKK